MRKAEENGYKCAGMSDILATYRIGENSLSSNKLKAAAFQWVALTEGLDISPAEAVIPFLLYMTRGITDRIKRKLKM